MIVGEYKQMAETFSLGENSLLHGCQAPEGYPRVATNRVLRLGGRAVSAHEIAEMLGMTVDEVLEPQPSGDPS